MKYLLAILVMSSSTAFAGHRRSCYVKPQCVDYCPPVVYQEAYAPPVYPEPAQQSGYPQSVIPEESTIYAYGDAVVKVGPTVDAEALSFRLLRIQENMVDAIGNINAQNASLIQSLASVQTETKLNLRSETKVSVPEPNIPEDEPTVFSTGNLVATYCGSCHMNGESRDGVKLDADSSYHDAFHAVLAERMPPESAKQPTDAERLQLIQIFGGFK